jgi:hypothetical protein
MEDLLTGLRMAKRWHGGWKHVAAGKPTKTTALRITGSPFSAISIALRYTLIVTFLGQGTA